MLTEIAANMLDEKDVGQPGRLCFELHDWLTLAEGFYDAKEPIMCKDEAAALIIYLFGRLYPGKKQYVQYTKT